MKASDLREFFEPHVKAAGFELKDIYEITLEPFHWVIHYYIREPSGALKHYPELDGPPTGILRMELTNNAPTSGQS